MYRTGRKAAKLYNQHRKLSYDIETHGRYASAVRADANFRRAHHDAHENPNHEMFGQGYEVEPPTHVEVYTETQDLLDRARVYDSRQNLAQAKYDRNIQKAAKHARRHLPKYIEMAQIDMQAMQEAEQAVSDGAEDFLRQQSS